MHGEHQRTALEARGGRCEFCGSRFRVEIDHVRGWAITHETKVDDLSFKCWGCHDAKTRHKLREEGPPGNRRLVHPDGRPWRPPMGGPDPPGDPPDDPPAEPVQADLFTLAH